MMLLNPDAAKAKILIVDDQPANVLLLEKILANIGYQQVVSCLDPTAVCTLHLQHNFDLILLDLQMPVMNGFEVMAALKEVEAQSYTPILVITAQPSEKLRALQAGAKDFVSKPFELIELQTRIANMLEVRLLYQKLADYNLVLERTVEERTLQLKQSEERFKNFTNLSADWYWEQDINGDFINTEGPVLDMLGITPSSQWDADEFTQLQNKIEARTPFLNHVYSRTLADGSHQCLQVSGEPIFDHSGIYIGYRGIGMEINDNRRNK